MAKQFRLPRSTVRALDPRYPERWNAQRRKPAPRHLGVDEIFRAQLSARRRQRIEAACVDMWQPFDNLDREWMMKFIEHRVADPRMQRLIRKWWKAGGSEDGNWSETKVGTQ